MRYLNGREIRDFVKARQLHQVRSLRQSQGINLNLTIIQTKDDNLSNVYTNLKKRYGEDIEVAVDIVKTSATEAEKIIKGLDADSSVTGVLVQLPLDDISLTDKVINAISPDKDVDGLGDSPKWDPTTAMAINWLLAGYNISLDNKKIAIVGQGRLVGAPLMKMWRGSGYDVMALDDTCDDLRLALADKDIIVTATGVPGLIKSEMLKHGATVVDAGTASDGGAIKGDLAPEVYERDDLTLTPQKGGVGPLTIAALFDNVIRAGAVSTK